MICIHLYSLLRVPERTEFKLSVLVFRRLHGTAPPYLASELRRMANVDTRKRLRSSSTSALVKPSSCRTMIGDRAFFVAAPRAWNTLPSSVTASETLGTFKCRSMWSLAVISNNSTPTECQLQAMYK